MSLIKKELTEKSGYTIEFSVNRAEYDKAEFAAYKKQVAKMNVPGFRKGKAPKHIVERLYGKGVFFENAINECIPDAFEESIREAGLQTVGSPKFDLVSMEDGQDIVLSAQGFVKPDVSIEGYKGLQAEKSVDPVTDADVDAEVDRARERNARTIEVSDRAAREGDIANIDYEGFSDGVAFEGGKGEKHDLKLGSGSFIPGFEEQIVGKCAGDSFDVSVTFPADYHAKELAGKDATFKVKLNAVKFEQLPEADDEFAKDVSEFDTLAEYKADIRAKMEKRNEDRANSNFENELAKQLAEKIVGDVPEVMYDIEADNIVRDFDSRLRMQGMDLSTYMKYTGMTADALRAQYRPQAESHVKVRLALEKIAALENLAVTDEQIEEEYKRICDAYHVPDEQVRNMVSAEDIKADLLVGEAMKFVREHAKAKKPAAKKAAKPADADAAEAKPAAKKSAQAKKTEQ